MQLEPGAQGVVARCTDGYKVSLSLSQATQSYPGDLKAIVAYSKGGNPLVGDEGPLRLIVPQSSPGDKDSGGDANTPYCARMVCAVEVIPLPAGLTPPSPGSIPSGSLAVYGTVTVREPVVEPQPGGQQPRERIRTPALYGSYHAHLAATHPGHGARGLRRETGGLAFSQERGAAYGHVRGLPVTWSGAALSEILARYGVEGAFSELRIVAWDEYVAKVPYDIAMRPDSILAYEQEGEPLPREDCPTRLVVGSEDGFYWIRMIVRLEIVR